MSPLCEVQQRQFVFSPTHFWPPLHPADKHCNEPCIGIYQKLNRFYGHPVVVDRATVTLRLTGCVLMIGAIPLITLLWGMRQKIKWMDFAFPFSDDTDRNLNDLKFYPPVSFRSVRSSSIARHSLQITTTWTTSICVGTPSIWWDGIYCLWDWWKITRVFSPLH